MTTGQFLFELDFRDTVIIQQIVCLINVYKKPQLQHGLEIFLALLNQDDPSCTYCDVQCNKPAGVPLKQEAIGSLDGYNLDPDYVFLNLNPVSAVNIRPIYLNKKS